VVVIKHGCIKLEIDRYGFFEADTDISAIHGLIADTNISKILKSCFLLIKNVMYFMPYLFFKNLKKKIYELKSLNLQQFQCLVTC